MKLNKLQLITVSLFIFTILIMIIGLMILGFCDYHFYNFNQSTRIWEDEKHNGFYFLKVTSIYRILSCSATRACIVSNNNGNFYSWIQLQIGVVLFAIFVPILGLITLGGCQKSGINYFIHSLIMLRQEIIRIFYVIVSLSYYYFKNITTKILIINFIYC